MVSEQEYTSWQETNYLLANPANAAHLRRSLAEADAGQFQARSLVDPRTSASRTWHGRITSGFRRMILESSRASTLIRDAKRTPFKAIGKPAPLKVELQGYWSRRITEEHRLVYRVESMQLLMLTCRYHYG